MFKRLCQFCKREISADASVEPKKEQSRYLFNKCGFILVEKYMAIGAVTETEFNYDWIRC
ncbi:MAG TPA: hypothetical protein VED00_04075 [archaeon]|nr:hypothetical protein [archaeon]